MDSKSYKKGIRVGKFLDLTEYAIIPILHRNTKDLKITKNLRYGDGPREEYDVIELDRETLRPVIFYVHGGGFISGVRAMRTYISAEYARAGYRVFNLDYQLAPSEVFPYQIHQLAKAIDYVISKKEEYNLDLSKVIIAGESAGGFLSSYLANVITNENLSKAIGVKLKSQGEFNLDSVVLLNGCYSAKSMSKLPFPNMPTFVKSFFDATKEELEQMDEEKVSLLSALDHITPSFPKTVVGRSKADGLDAESVLLTEQLKANNVPYVEFMAGGINSPHGWCLATFTKEGKRCLDITLDYIK